MRSGALPAENLQQGCKMWRVALKITKIVSLHFIVGKVGKDRFIY